MIKIQINQAIKSDSAKKELRQFIAEDLTKKSKKLIALYDHLLEYQKDYEVQTKMLVETITILECLAENEEASKIPRNSMQNSKKSIQTSNLTDSEQSQLDNVNIILSGGPISRVTSSFE